MNVKSSCLFVLTLFAPFYNIQQSAFAAAVPQVMSGTSSAKDHTHQVPVDPQQQLLAIQEITSLKARYFRLVDTKKFDQLTTVFAPDAQIFFPEQQAKPLGVTETIVAMKEVLKDVVTVHYGYMPDVEITSPTTAKGIWGMSDHLWFAKANAFDASEMGGWGYDHDTYVKIDGRWLIQSVTFERVQSFKIRKR